jgi:hypothetical protein
MTNIVQAHVVEDEYDNPFVYVNDSGCVITFTLEEKYVDVEAKINNIKIYNKQVYHDDFIGNVSALELNVIYDMMIECGLRNNVNKTIRVEESNDDILVDFNVSHGKHFNYHFQIEVPQKTANENDLVEMMSSMQSQIMKLQRENIKLKQEVTLLTEHIQNQKPQYVEFDGFYETKLFNGCVPQHYITKTKLWIDPCTTQQITLTNKTKCGYTFKPNDVKMNLEPLRLHLFENLLTLKLLFVDKPSIDTHNINKCYEPISNCVNLKNFECKTEKKNQNDEDDANIGQIGMTNLNFLEQLLNLETIGISRIKSLKNIDAIYSLPRLTNVYINTKMNEGVNDQSTVEVEDRFVSGIKKMNTGHMGTSYNNWHHKIP